MKLQYVLFHPILVISFLFIEIKSSPKKIPSTPFIDNKFLTNSFWVSSFW